MPDVVVYFDSSGAGGTLSTLDDWAGLVAWVDVDVPTDDYPCVHHLVENGWEDDLPALTAQLEDALAAHPPDTTDVEGVARELLDVVESRAEEDTAVAIGVGDSRSPTGNTGMSARLGTQLAGFISAGNDWPEFTTWAHSLPPGDYTTVKTLSVNAQVEDAGSLDSELRQAAVDAPPETDGAVAVAGRLLSILGDYVEPTGRLSVVANELSHSDLERRLEALLLEKYQPAGGSYSNPTSLDSVGPSPYLIDVYDDHIVYRWMDRTYTLGYTVNDQTDKVALDTGDPVEIARVTEYVPVDNAGTPTVNQLEYLTPLEACEVLSEGEFEGEELSYDDEEFLRERCSGFTANAGKRGLSIPDVTPEKACVLPGQEVQGRVSAASKAWYAGEVVRIATASGVTLSVTPNHPVMTAEGFVPAGDLQEGHDLLKYVGEDQSPVGVEDVQQAPARAEEVFVALAAGHGEEACPVGTLDFHGDAVRFKGDVQIVAAHGTLRRDVVADRPQGFLQGNLVGTGEGQSPLAGSGRPGQVFGRLLAATVGGVRRRSNPHPLLGGQVPEAEPVGLGDVAEDAPGLQFTVDDGPPEADLVGNDVGGVPGQVTVDHLPDDVRRHQDLGSCRAAVEAFRRFGPGAELDAACPEDLSYSPRRDAVLAGELFHGSAGKVVLDKVVAVERFHYEGPVYDFQSPLGYVLAQKLVISNCKIVKDGAIRGKELTPRQRGLFGIICGRRKKPRGPARNHFVGSETQDSNHQTNFVANEREETSMSRLTDEQRRIIVDNLVANTGCGCHGQTMPWPNERAALEKLTDNELAFADGCRKALVQNHASGPGGGSVATGPTAAQGAQGVVDPSQVIVPVATPVKAPANMAEALATYGTAQDREVWNSALAIHAHEKASVIETIVANVTGEARERLIARLQTKNIDELRELAVLGAQHRVQPQPLSPAVNWFGASAAAVAPPVQEEPLSSPVYNFERRSA
jgi:hypothetical protein